MPPTSEVMWWPVDSCDPMGLQVLLCCQTAEVPYIFAGEVINAVFRLGLLLGQRENVRFVFRPESDVGALSIYITLLFCLHLASAVALIDKKETPWRRYTCTHIRLVRPALGPFCLLKQMV